MSEGEVYVKRELVLWVDTDLSVDEVKEEFPECSVSYSDMLGMVMIAFPSTYTRDEAIRMVKKVLKPRKIYVYSYP